MVFSSLSGAEVTSVTEVYKVNTISLSGAEVTSVTEVYKVNTISNRSNFRSREGGLVKI